MSVYNYIAFHDGSLFSIWGPCSGDGKKLHCDCPQCRHADKLAADGKDWDLEYEKARLRNFDMVSDEDD